jgi:hypothetical protein
MRCDYELPKKAKNKKTANTGEDVELSGAHILLLEITEEKSSQKVEINQSLKKELIYKGYCVLTMELYLVITRTELLTLPSIWVHLKNIILHKRSKTKKSSTYCMIPFK